MNDDKLTTLDDEILDNVSGGAPPTVGEAFVGMLDSTIDLVDAIADARDKRVKRFWNALTNHHKAY